MAEENIVVAVLASVLEVAQSLRRAPSGYTGASIGVIPDVVKGTLPTNCGNSRKRTGRVRCGVIAEEQSFGNRVPTVGRIGIVRNDVGVGRIRLVCIPDVEMDVDSLIRKRLAHHV